MNSLKYQVVSFLLSSTPRKKNITSERVRHPLTVHSIDDIKTTFRRGKLCSGAHQSIFLECRQMPAAAACRGSTSCLINQVNQSTNRAYGVLITFTPCSLRFHRGFSSQLLNLFGWTVFSCACADAGVWNSRAFCAADLRGAALRCMARCVARYVSRWALRVTRVSKRRLAWQRLFLCALDDTPFAKILVITNDYSVSFADEIFYLWYLFRHQAEWSEARGIYLNFIRVLSYLLLSRNRIEF